MDKLWQWTKVKNNRDLVVVLTVLAALLVIYGVYFLMPQDQNEPIAPVVAQDNQDERERKLAAILSTLEGVGEVRVMITEKTVASTGQGLITDNTSKEIQGVIVSAQGAGDIRVRIMLIQAVKTALNIDSEAIEVYPMASGP